MSEAFTYPLNGLICVNEKTGLSNEAETATTSDVVEFESTRPRLSDMYIGIIIGTLAAFILLMIVIGILVTIQYRRHKYRTGTFSKCIYAADLEDFDVGVISMSTLSNQKILSCNGYNTAVTLAARNGTESAKELAVYQTSNTLHRMPPTDNRDNNKSFRRKPEKSRSMPLTGEKVSSHNNHAVLVVNLPEKPLFQPPVPPPLTNNHRGAIHPISMRHDTKGEDTSQYKSNVSRRSLANPSVIAPLHNSPGPPASERNNGIIPERHKHLEIPSSNLSFVMQLGDGIFGEVLLSELKLSEKPMREDTAVKSANQSQLVAIKMLHRNTTRVRTEFFREIDLMLTLRDPNIVQVLGVCKQAECPGVVIEYLHGTLRQCLLNSDHEEDALTEDLPPHSRLLSYGCMIYMGMQIACGMKFLEDLHLIHRDLSTRNCLVGQHYTVKISDLGIGHVLYATDYYTLDDSAPLPIRWMAWESVILSKFSCKSDVWAFAVTLWEILTLAREQPFLSLADEQIISICEHHYLNDGLETYLIQPSNCPKEIFDLMMECWNRDVEQRPSFREIHMFLRRKNTGFNPSEEFVVNTDV